MAYTDIDDPSAFFQIALYTGNNSNNVITNDGNSDLKPDFIWAKSRTSTSYTDDHFLVDSSRGVTKGLKSNTTAVETTSAGGTDLKTFNTDGFTVGATNASAALNAVDASIVAWQWKCQGGTTASNTSGTINSTVQANTDAGFSIVTYTGTGGGETFGHGLGVAPDMWIIKRRSGTGSWAVGFNDANILGGTSKYLILQGTGGVSTYNNFWGTSPASSTVMRIAGDATIGGSGSTYVAYAFAEKQGYSKFGKYVGNGNANGAFIYTGFKPAWVMVKRTDGVTNWRLFDSKRSGFNGDTSQLYPNLANAEDAAGDQIDLLSNGFKNRTASGDQNISGASYIYMAFAENPFTTSTGIPTTAR